MSEPKEWAEIGLDRRIEEAQRRVSENLAPRRIPAHWGDVDLVLGACQCRIRELEALLTELRDGWFEPHYGLNDVGYAALLRDKIRAILAGKAQREAVCPDCARRLRLVAGRFENHLNALADDDCERSDTGPEAKA